TAAGEDDLVGMSVEDGGGTFAGVLEGTARTPARRVSAGGIAEDVGEERPHGFPHGRQEGGGRVVVEIDRVHERPRRKVSGRRRETHRPGVFPARCPSSL